MIEALACGTPVIAYPFGSVPEIVADGTAGFIVPDIDSAVDAVHGSARSTDEIAGGISSCISLPSAWLKTTWIFTNGCVEGSPRLLE